MSDPGRKSLSRQVTEKTTPDSQKTTGEKIKETLTGTVDRVKAAVTPDSQKSVTQQAADRTRGSTSATTSTDRTYY
jgi:hypothetical protein